jgi:RecJ-like exonuclease
MVAQGLEEPPAKKCKCREKIDYKKADAKVKAGEARWVVTARERGTREVPCSLCNGSEEVKNCAQCSGTGKQTESVVWDTYNYDIVLVSQASADASEKKYRPALAMKTPRVATIESEHIERAYVEGNKDAADRIEEYGMLILDARTYVGKNRIPAIGVEPPDDPKTGTGRNYDFGRAI